MRTTILFLSLISMVVLPTAVYANGEATQCILTLSKVEFKSTLGEWKTAYEGHLPLDIAAPDAVVKFDNQGAPEGSYVRVRLTLDETFQVSGSDGGAYTREGGEIEIRGTASNLEGLPGQIQSLAEKKPTYSEHEAGLIRVTLDYDFADRDKIIELSSSRDFEKPLLIKKASKITLSMRADIKAAIVHVWPDYYNGFPEKDVMIFDFPKNISELSVKADGATAFAAGGIEVKF